MVQCVIARNILFSAEIYAILAAVEDFWLFLLRINELKLLWMSHYIGPLCCTIIWAVKYYLMSQVIHRAQMILFYLINCRCSNPDSKASTADCWNDACWRVTAQNETTSCTILLHCPPQCMLCVFGQTINFRQ